MSLFSRNPHNSTLLRIICIFLIIFVDLSLQYTLRLSPSADNTATEIYVRPRQRRNMLMFSKFHRSMWPYEQDAPKRFVAMDSDPYFEY